jgi:hypothetical protein
MFLRNALFLMVVVLSAAGCIESKNRLINSSDAVFPFDLLVLKDSDGAVMVISKGADGYYTHEIKDGASVKSNGPILIASVGGSLVAQELDDNRQVYGFGILRIEDKSFRVWGCNGYRAEDVSAAGIKIDDLTCTIENIEQLEKLIKLPVREDAIEPSTIVYRE